MSLSGTRFCNALSARARVSRWLRTLLTKQGRGILFLVCVLKTYKVSVLITCYDQRETTLNNDPSSIARLHGAQNCNGTNHAAVAHHGRSSGIKPLLCKRKGFHDSLQASPLLPNSLQDMLLGRNQTAFPEFRVLDIWNQGMPLVEKPLPLLPKIFIGV